MAVEDGNALVFVNFADQRIWRLDPGSTEPRAALARAGRAGGTALRRPAALAGRARGAVGARGAPGRDASSRHIVAIPLDGSAAADPAWVREVAGGSDFLASPQISPDGEPAGLDRLGPPRTCPGTAPSCGSRRSTRPAAPPTYARCSAGRPNRSCTVANDRTIYVISDRSGWWNLYAVGAAGGDPRALHQRAEEFAEPMWTLGSGSYVILDDQRIAVIHGTETRRLGLLDPATGILNDLDLDYTDFGGISAAGHRLFTTAASPTESRALIAVDLGSRTDHQILRSRQSTTVPRRRLPADAGVASCVTGEQRPRRARASSIRRPTPTSIGPAGRAAALRRARARRTDRRSRRAL